MQFYLGFFFLLIKLYFVKGQQEEEEARIIYNVDGSWEIVEKDFKEDALYVATAYYTPTLNTTGWDILAITTNKIFNDELQAEAAGRLEGHLTKERIWNHFINGKSMTKTISAEVRQFLLDQEEFIKSEYKTNKENPHVYFAYLTYLQFSGLREQYNLESENKIENIDFHFVASITDLKSIQNKFTPPEFDKMTTKEIFKFTREQEHCSAIFKLKDDLSDIFFGHNTWHYYPMMNRILKEMNFNYNHPDAKAKVIIFSSYPATLSSADDFYVTDQYLSVIETTNPVYNSEIFSLIDYKSYLPWVRAMTANIMSATAEEWGEHFKDYNSGTYNNQWMVLDMKKVDLNKKVIENKSFFISEQIPGYVAINDVTEQLKYGYWPSYNTPFDKVVIEKSKIQEAIKNNSELFNEIDYDANCRANIFRREQGKIKTLNDLKELMRYNNYTEDPLALKSPWGTISARGDFENDCDGAIDAKVGSVAEFKENKTIHVISGPTDQGVPPFDWTNCSPCKEAERKGLPDKPKYEWIQYKSRFIH